MDCTQINVQMTNETPENMKRGTQKKRKEDWEEWKKCSWEKL